MKTSQHTINQLGLQTLKTLALLMTFAGSAFLLSNTTISALENSLAYYEEATDIFKILND